MWRWCRTSVDRDRWVPVPFPLPGGTNNPPSPNAPAPWWGRVVEVGPLVDTSGKPVDPAEVKARQHCTKLGTKNEL